MAAASNGVALQSQLIVALREVVDGLTTYRITRQTAAALLHAALALRHRDHQSQSPPRSIECTQGYGYGAVLERVAFDFAGALPLTSHLAVITAMADALEAGLPDFYATHRLYSQPKKTNDF